MSYVTCFGGLTNKEPLQKVHRIEITSHGPSIKNQSR